jgi:dTDP-4-amino-4,6-dideoxygalactose transaminase
MTAVSPEPDGPTTFMPPEPLVDLASQHAEVSAEIGRGMDRVMRDTSFINGADVAAFEQAWATYCGLNHAVGVASGTDALELALRAAGIGPGDEVIVPANSFIASAGAVARAGASPRLVDCDPVYLLMDPTQVATVVTTRTRAVLPVHLYGQMAPMQDIAAVAGAAGLQIIEDAAQAHGARQGGRRVGSWGVAAAFSFYPGKNLGAYGDAGAVATDSASLAQSVAALRNHGNGSRYEHATLGFNARLDTLQAVVLNAKLSRLDRWNSSRLAAAQRYDRMLADLPDVVRPSTLAGNDHVWHLYVVRVPDRDRVVAALRDAGVGAGIHYPTPIHRTGAFAHLGYTAGSFPVAEQAATEILSLPMHPHLDTARQERVVEALAAALR